MGLRSPNHMNLPCLSSLKQIDRSICAVLGLSLFLIQLTTTCTAAGTVVAWGANDSLQSLVPRGLTNVVAVAAGDAHSLALKTDGTVVAWGFNAFGQTTVPHRL